MSDPVINHTCDACQYPIRPGETSISLDRLMHFPLCPTDPDGDPEFARALVAHMQVSLGHARKEVSSDE